MTTISWFREVAQIRTRCSSPCKAVPHLSTEQGAALKNIKQAKQRSGGVGWGGVGWGGIVEGWSRRKRQRCCRGRSAAKHLPWRRAGRAVSLEMEWSLRSSRFASRQRPVRPVAAAVPVPAVLSFAPAKTGNVKLAAGQNTVAIAQAIPTWSKALLCRQVQRQHRLPASGWVKSKEAVNKGVGWFGSACLQSVRLRCLSFRIPHPCSLRFRRALVRALVFDLDRASSVG